MKKITILLFSLSAFFVSCSKSDPPDTSVEDFAKGTDAGIADFVNIMALPAYTALHAKADSLVRRIDSLTANPTAANLSISKNAWADMKTIWQLCGGFNFGPVKTQSIDVQIATSPVDTLALLATINNAANTFDPANMDALPPGNKGFHAMEFLLWGGTGTKTAGPFTTQEKDYLKGLALHLKAQTLLLKNSWLPPLYATAFLTAGKGSIVYPKKRDAYMALITAMSDACKNLSQIKMKLPYDSGDSLSTESPFSKNTLTDFRNTISGAYNVYLCRFAGDGAALENLVNAREVTLDNEIQTKFQLAQTRLGQITVNYEVAIRTQRQQCLDAMTALNDLAATLDIKLKAFAQQNIGE